MARGRRTRFGFGDNVDYGNALVCLGAVVSVALLVVILVKVNKKSCNCGGANTKMFGDKSKAKCVYIPGSQPCGDKDSNGCYEGVKQCTCTKGGVSMSGYGCKACAAAGGTCDSCECSS